MNGREHQIGGGRPRRANPAAEGARQRAACRGGFTLLEVMIACGIFFMATFTILALVANTLRNARGIQRIEVDAGMAASQVYEIFKTNRQAEISLAGDFGDSYRDYAWTADSTEFDTNGLLAVRIIVTRRGLRKPVDSLDLLVFNPNARPFGAAGR
jgi:type II secretory pathway pseudopilin PulG